MTPEELKTYKFHLLNPRFIKKNYPDVFEFLNNKYPYLTSISEKLYWFQHDLTDFPRCTVCGQPTNFTGIEKGYRDYCSYKCMNNDNHKKEKTKQTCLEKYGAENPQQVNIFREKTKQTCLKRYGVENVSKNKEILEKTKQTCLKRYGVEYPSQCRIIKEKSRRTKLERYGDTTYTNRDKFFVTMNNMYGGVGNGSVIIKEKVKNTNLKKYNAENPFANEEIKNKIKETNLERYGVENPFANEEIKNKIKETNLERYGVEYATQSTIIKRKLQNKLRRNILEKHPDIINYTEDGQWIHKCPHSECNKCQEKNFIIKSSHLYDRLRGGSELCTKLLPIQSMYSSLELWVRNILDECNIEYNENDRSVLGGKELDIYIPSKKIAIECNGIYWHSSAYKSRSYHRDKFKSCLDAGVQLLTVWEDQIVNHPDIVKSVILSKLGIYNERLGARQCTVKEISNSEANKFLDMNHIQGRTQQKLSLGLYYKDRLAGVMTFNHRSKLSGSKQVDLTEWELTRFCTLLNIQIIGAADKLFKYFINKYSPRKVTSFSSNDISTGGLYKKLGFESDMTISGAYWYIEDTTMRRYHRSTFSKGALKKRGIDIRDKTESEIMSELPYHRIDDSGHMRWEWIKKETI